jgi:hypothetical protein
LLQIAISKVGPKMKRQKGRERGQKDRKTERKEERKRGLTVFHPYLSFGEWEEVFETEE